MPKRFRLEQPLDLELLHRAMHLAYLVPNASILRPTASGQAAFSSLPLPWRVPRVGPNGAPGIVGAGDETQNEARHQCTTAPNPTSGRANSRGTPRPKGPRSYPPTRDTQRRLAVRHSAALTSVGRPGFAVVSRAAWACVISATRRCSSILRRSSSADFDVVSDRGISGHSCGSDAPLSRPVAPRSAASPSRATCGTRSTSQSRYCRMAASTFSLKS